jgi:tetratricopeptide (TPR) repeat protein
MTEESLFHEALALRSEERAAFLRNACADRPALHAAVAELIAAHERSGEFLAAAVLAPPEASEAVETDAYASATDPASQSMSSVTADATDSTRTAQPVAPSAAPVVMPARIGRYRVREELGRGGMGTVYLAHDPELDRLVALKVPKVASPEAGERFLREVRAAAAVGHPNLCPVHDAGRADGVLYLTMAYVPGDTLAQVLKRDGRLTPARASTIAIAIARGMAEAHRHGIVHRDLKPGNILFDRRGEPVVTDFGLARRASVIDPVADADATTEHDPRLTQAGALIGTPAYMPPEQARGDQDRIGPASDVYALGAILFEMLTGTPPYRGATIAETLHKIEHDGLPAMMGVPGRLAAVARKALARDPADRFASMDEFAGALAPFAATARRSRLAKVVATAAAGLLFLLAGTVIYVKTDYGTIEVQLNEAAAGIQVTVDGNEVQVTDRGRVTRVRSGDHALLVNGPDFETETQQFKVKRGERTVVAVTLRPKVKPSAPSPAPDRAKLAELLARIRRLSEEGQVGPLVAVTDEALRIDSESPTALAGRATVRIARGDLPAARADVAAALKLNPETPQALFLRGYLAGEDGRPDDNIADQTAVLRLEPRRHTALNNRAVMYLAKKEYRQAIADASRALDLAPDRPDPLRTRAAAHAFLGEYKEALADFDQVVRLVATDARALTQRSTIHAKLGHADQSAADWAVAQKLNPGLTEMDRPVLPDLPKAPDRKKLAPEHAAQRDARMQAAQAAWDQSRDSDSLKAVEEAVRIDPTHAAARSLRARIWVKAGRYQEAIDEANEAIRLNPDDSWAFNARGAAREALIADAAAAIADYTIGIRLDPMNPWLWNNRGYAYWKRGQYYQALADVAEGLRLKPDAGALYLNRGMYYLHLGEYSHALADYTRAADLFPTNARWRLVCGLIRARLGDAEGARMERTRAAAIDPSTKDTPDLALPAPLPPRKQDPELPKEPAKGDVDRAALARLLARGELLIHRSRFLELKEVADEALALDPESPGALALRATYRADRHEWTGAKADIEAALKLNPETFQAWVLKGFLRIELTEGTPDEGIAELNIAIRLRENSPISWSNRALMYLARGDYRQAIADADRALKLGDKAHSALLTRASAHAFLGAYDLALSDFDEAAKRAKGDARIYVQRSAVYAKMGNAPAADADWQTARRLTMKNLHLSDRPVIPDAPKPPQPSKLAPEQVGAMDRALASAGKAFAEGRCNDALKYADQAIQIDPVSSAAHVLRVRSLTHLGRYREAVAAAALALPLAPTEPWVYVARGIARGEVEAPTTAIADLTIALTLDPNNHLAWSNRGYAYYLGKHYHQALADLTESIRLAPQATTYCNRGNCHVYFGRYEEALKDFQKAEEKQPLNARLPMMCSFLRARLGDAEGAKKDRERAIAIDPKIIDAGGFELPARLAPIKKDPDF